MESLTKAKLANNVFKKLIDLVYIQMKEDIKNGREGPENLSKELLQFLIENKIARIGLNYSFDPPKMELLVYPQ